MDLIGNRPYTQGALGAMYIYSALFSFCAFSPTFLQPVQSRWFLFLWRGNVLYTFDLSNKTKANTLETKVSNRARKLVKAKVEVSDRLFALKYSLRKNSWIISFLGKETDVHQSNNSN